MQILGKTALVTGGSAGIGQHIAGQLVAQGARVVIVARDRARAAAFAAAHTGAITVLQADLSRSAEQDRIVAEIAGRWPELAILVNNAGIQTNMSDVGVGDEGRMAEFRAEIDLNLTAPIALSFGLMPLLAGQPEAAIVNISSGLAIAPKRTAPVYCASKAGLSAFSRALRYRCEDAAPTVQVIDVVMALVETGMTHGRAGTKMAPADAARAVVEGLVSGRSEVWVGRSRLLGVLHRVSPRLAFRMLRNA